MTDEESNELSWLKGEGKLPSAKGKVPTSISPRSQEANDAPSWLFEEQDKSISSARGSTEASPHPPAIKEKSAVKWKVSVNKPREEEDDTEDESDTCCCCCPADPMLFAFQSFHFVSGLIGLLALAANIYIFTRPDLTLKDAIMRCYALIFCALVLIVEFDWRFVVSKIRFVDWWVLRGFFYTLIGFVTCKFGNRWVKFYRVCCPNAFISQLAVGITDATAEISSAPQEIAGIMLAAVGVCYIIMVIYFLLVVDLAIDTHLIFCALLFRAHSA